MFKNKMESNGINVASIMPGRIQEHPDDLVKIAEEIATAGLSREERCAAPSLGRNSR